MDPVENPFRHVELSKYFQGNAEFVGCDKLRVLRVREFLFLLGAERHECLGRGIVPSSDKENHVLERYFVNKGIDRDFQVVVLFLEEPLERVKTDYELVGGGRVLQVEVVDFIDEHRGFGDQHREIRGAEVRKSLMDFLARNGGLVDVGNAQLKHGAQRLLFLGNKVEVRAFCQLPVAFVDRVETARKKEKS